MKFDRVWAEEGFANPFVTVNLIYVGATVSTLRVAVMVVDVIVHGTVYYDVTNYKNRFNVSVNEVVL